MLVADGDFDVEHGGGDETNGVAGEAFVHLGVLLAADGLVVAAAVEDGCTRLLDAVGRKALVLLFQIKIILKQHKADELRRGFTNNDDT